MLRKGLSENREPNSCAKQIFSLAIESRVWNLYFMESHMCRFEDLVLFQLLFLAKIPLETVTLKSIHSFNIYVADTIYIVMNECHPLENGCTAGQVDVHQRGAIYSMTIDNSGQNSIIPCGTHNTLIIYLL